MKNNEWMSLQSERKFHDFVDCWTVDKRLFTFVVFEYTNITMGRDLNEWLLHINEPNTV